jgi:hypothetical protein
MAYQSTLVNLLSESKAFQFVMDNAVAQFEQPIWNKYLTERFSLSLDWRGILAVMENSPAASVIDFSSGKPIATRPAISKINGELAAFGNKYQMSKRQVRDLLELQDNVGKMGINVATLLDHLIPDVKRATLGPHKAIDRLLLEAMSTGVMTLTAANNPKGVIWNSSLDWGVTKKYVSVVWSTANAATMKPITDIKKVVADGIAAGKKYSNIKMSSATFDIMVGSTQFIDSFKTQMGNFTQVSNVLLAPETVTALFRGVGLPAIEIIDYPVQVEAKDGSYSTVLPFADNRVTFSVSDNFGELLYSYANEQRRPVAGKSYATALNVLVSKFSDNDGNEFTEGEFNAFPVINAANTMNILVTNATSA